MSKNLKLGFALITHSNPEQIYRLTNLLGTMFPDCQISCHHDFSKEPNLQKKFSPRVQFVTDYIKPTWGCFSVVEAGIKALRLLCDSEAPPDWIYLISGSDFPVKSPSYINNFLNITEYDVFITHLNVSKFVAEGRWQQYLRNRYLSGIDFPCGYECYAGEQWFTANIKAVKLFLQTVDKNPSLIEYYQMLEYEKGAVCPDESFYQTVFCNLSEIKIKNDSLRYIDWSNSDSSPRILGMSDCESIQDSEAHFARKFDLERDKEILDILEKICTGKNTYTQKLSSLKKVPAPKGWLDVFLN